MSKKKDTVRMWVARDKWATGKLSSYVLSFCKLKCFRTDDEITWFDKYENGYAFSPKDFHKMFDYHLRPGEGPFLVEFPKIAMKAVKK